MPLHGPKLSAPFAMRDLLQVSLASKPDDVALASLNTRWTWRALEQAALGHATGLAALGLRTGDRVASLMPNRGDLIVHYLGCLKAGVVAVPLNYRYMPPEIDYALEVSGASVLLAHEERAADLAACRQVGRLPLGVIHFADDDSSDDRGDGGGNGTGHGTRFGDVAATAPSETAMPDVGDDDPALIFFTSGSTGRPKGVTHSYRTLGWTIATGAAGQDMMVDDTVMPCSSLSHVGGYGYSMAGLGSGARVLVVRGFDTDELLPLLRTYRPTLFSMLPSALMTLVRDPAVRPDDLASIRFCHSGGDAVSAELRREFTDLTGVDIDNSVGMTEAGLCTMNPPSRPSKPGSAGRPSAAYTLSLRDEDGNEMPVGQPGRLWVKSPTVMLGYWHRPELTAGAIVDGWFDTGDVLSVDEDGFLWYFGRRKQIIVHDGSNISPLEIEASLLDHPAVASAGVVGVCDHLHGEDVWAFVTLRDGAEPMTSQALIAFSREQVGYKAPEVVEILDEMPLNPTGKVDRNALKQRAARHVGVVDTG